VTVFDNDLADFAVCDRLTVVANERNFYVSCKMTDRKKSFWNDVCLRPTGPRDD
jgi:hypothetical protein